MRSKLLFIFAISILLAQAAVAQRGATTISRNLAELSSQAETIFHGRIISAHVEPHPQFSNLQTVVVSVAVDDVLKGDPGASYTFRQYIWDFRDVEDAAGYRKGLEVLLLMNRTTPYGLTSPAGLGQGRFTIRTDTSGKKFAANERNNDGLFRDVQSQLSGKGIQLSPRLSQMIAHPKAGPMQLDDLRNFILTVLQEKTK